MAEFHYLASRNDLVDWLKALAKMGRFTFVVDRPYHTPFVPIYVDAADELIDHVMNMIAVPRVRIYSTEYSLFSPVLRGPYYYDWCGTGTFVLSDSLGGPSLDIHASPMYVKDERLRIDFVSLRYRSSFGNPERTEWYLPSEQLKSAFKDVKRLIVSLMVRKRFAISRDSKTKQKTIHLGQEVLLLMQREKALINSGVEDGWLGIEDLST